MKVIRANFAAKKAQVGIGFGAGVMAGLFGKKTVGKMNVITRENLRREQMNAFAPYEGVSRSIDEILVQHSIVGFMLHYCTGSEARTFRARTGNDRLGRWRFDAKQGAKNQNKLSLPPTLQAKHHDKFIR